MYFLDPAELPLFFLVSIIVKLHKITALNKILLAVEVHELLPLGGLFQCREALLGFLRDQLLDRRDLALVKHRIKSLDFLLLLIAP